MQTRKVVACLAVFFLAAGSRVAAAPRVFLGHDITGGFVSPSQLVASDFNRDGRPDLLVTGWEPGASGTAWLENKGGGSFAAHTVTSVGFTSHLTPAPMDGDADLDLVAGLGSAGWGFTWWENQGTAFARHDVDPPVGDYDFDTWDVFPGDLNGDGAVDMVAAGGAYAAGGAKSFAWWENQGTRWVRHVVTGTYTGSKSVRLLDLDKDGDRDILLCLFGSGASANAIVWWENGVGNAFTEHKIGDTLQADDVFPADLDKDGDVDLLTADGYGIGFRWWENMGAMGFVPRTIKGGAVVASSIGAADLDGDGDLDVYGTDQGNKRVLWFQNGGSQDFTERPVDDDSLASYHVLVAADFNGDGNTDLAAESGATSRILWWENEFLANRSFETGARLPRHWAAGNLTTADGRTARAFHTGRVSFRIAGTRASKSLAQTLRIRGRAGDTFTLEGWSKAVLPAAAGGPYALEAKVYYDGRPAQVFRASFGKTTHAWQRRAKTFVATGPYSRIVVSLLYVNQRGTAYFDDVRLLLR